MTELLYWRDHERPLGIPIPAWQDAAMNDDGGNSQETEDEGDIAERLAAQILQGSEIAEAAFYRRYVDGLYRLLRYKTRDDEVAKDLCQETFLKALEKLRRVPLQEPRKLANWLARFANNVWRNHVKGQKPDVEIPRELPNPDPGPETLVSREEYRELVRGMIQELRIERDREILRRTFVEDQYKEEVIEKVDGLDDARDYHRVLHRAKQRLLELIREKLDE